MHRLIPTQDNKIKFLVNIQKHNCPKGENTNLRTLLFESKKGKNNKIKTDKTKTTTPPTFLGTARKIAISKKKIPIQA